MGGGSAGQGLERARTLFFAALDDDMNTSGALGAMFENIVGGVRGLVESGAGSEAADFLAEAWSIFGIAPALDRQPAAEMFVRIGDAVALVDVKRYVDMRWSPERQARTLQNLQATIGDRLGANGQPLAALIPAAIEKRLEARRNKDFALGDQLRDALANEGVVLRDSKDETTWTLAGG
jgi:cysteinyl-tRNA synthetase